MGLWLLMSIISIPFHFYLIPNFGAHFSSIASHITIPLSEIIFLKKIEFGYQSDGIIYWIQIVTLLPASLIIYLIYLKISFRKDNLTHWLQISLTYILAFFLLKYGADKLFQNQFYPPEPNIAFTPAGQLSKDILFWTSMGTSSIYNNYMALAEIIPGILLLIPKFRKLGIIIAIGVLTNVVAVNYGFNITVKLLSSLLLLIAAYLTLPFIKSLYAFFILNKSAVDSEPLNERHIKNKRYKKGIITALMLLEILIPYTNHSKEVNTSSIGTYEILSNESLFLKDVKRIHIHSKKFLILENHNNEFKDFKYKSFGSFIQLNTGHQNVSIDLRKNETYRITIVEDGKKSSAKLREINLKNLPLYQDNLNITREGVLSN
jgi:hypothetical protein